jgi:signal transduction histidine kinase
MATSMRPTLLQREGEGVAGIRERVAVIGGEMDTGQRPDGGYAVRARLPLGSAR